MRLVTWQIVGLLLLASLMAGWVDAVSGGGGLIQLPALLIAPTVDPLGALATNKLASIAGTTTSAITYYRRVHPDLATAVPMAVFAGLGSASGAWSAHLVPTQVFRPVIVVALAVVLAYTLAKPALGQAQHLRFGRRQHLGVAAAVGAVVGFYDGILGPGTGSFLLFGLVGVIGYEFLQASAKAKIVNMATNLAALCVFVPAGHVIWGLGLGMATANVVGGYVGARSAVAGGSRFVRTVFVLVSGVLLIRLAWDVAAG
ncbi:MAG: hypothetical protein CSA58_05970 [Micrococcales bacterium]|nr:MAG: hypothetical protein CSA58_05970 [Micrococcales bacterium]